MSFIDIIRYELLIHLLAANVPAIQQPEGRQTKQGKSRGETLHSHITIRMILGLAWHQHRRH